MLLFLLVIFKMVMHLSKWEKLNDCFEMKRWLDLWKHRENTHSWMFLLTVFLSELTNADDDDITINY